MPRTSRTYNVRILLAIGIVVLFAFRAVVFNAEAFYGGDLLNHYIPHRQFLKESIADGYLPLWNPYIFSGQPFVANMQTVVFYPPALLCLVLPASYGFSLLVVLHFYFAAVAMFYFARLFFVRVEPALLAAAVFTFSGFFVSRLYPGLVLVIFSASWVPLIFYLAERLYRERAARFVLLLSLALAMQALSGTPQIALYTITAVGLFVVFQVASKGGGVIESSQTPARMARLKVVKDVVVAVVLAGGLVAVQMLPSLELSRLSAERATAASWEYVTKDSLVARYLVTFVAPDFFYDPTMEGLYWGGRQGYWEINAYVGIVPLLLALAAILFIGRRQRAQLDGELTECQRADRSRLVFFGVVGGVVSLWLSFGKSSLLFRLLYLVMPGFQYFRVPARWLLFYVFSVSLLAAYGLDVLQGIAQSRNRALMRRFMFGVLAFAGVIIGFCVVGLINIPATMTFFNISQVRPQDSFAQPSRFLLDLMHAMRSSLVLTIALTIASAGTALLLLIRRIPRGVGGVVGGLFGVALELLLRRIPRMVGVAALFCLLALDLGHYGAKFFQTRPFGDFNSSFYPETDLVQFLKESARDARVTYLEHVFYWFNDQNQIELFPNRAMMHHLYEARGYDPLYLRSYSEYFNAIGQKALGEVGGTFVSLEEVKNGNLLSLLNVRYMLSYERISAPGFGVLKRFPFGLNVYENQNARGWAFLAKSADGRSLSAEQMFENLADPQFDSLHHVFVEEVNSGAAGKCETASAESVAVAARLPDHSIYQVNVGDSDVLVFSEPYYPGWDGSVDGRREPIVRVDHALSGVFVPPGSHTVVKTFEPFSVRLGAAISLVSLLIVVAAMVLCSREGDGARGARREGG